MPTTSSPPIPANRQFRRKTWLIGLGVLLILFFAAVMPGSPLHLSVLFAPAPKDNGRGIEELVGALAHSDPAVRKEAALGFGRLTSSGSEALPRLAVVMRTDPDPGVRAAAADSIRKMIPASRTVVVELGSAPPRSRSERPHECHAGASRPQGGCATRHSRPDCRGR